MTSMKRNCSERQLKVTNLNGLSRRCFFFNERMITESHLQPYYDDERDQMCETDEDEDSEDEIVMVNRGGVVKGADSDSN